MGNRTETLSRIVVVIRGSRNLVPLSHFPFDSLSIQLPVSHRPHPSIHTKQQRFSTLNAILTRSTRLGTKTKISTLMLGETKLVCVGNVTRAIFRGRTSISSAWPEGNVLENSILRIWSRCSFVVSAITLQVFRSVLFLSFRLRLREVRRYSPCCPMNPIRKPHSPPSAKRGIDPCLGEYASTPIC